jgi:hypothetical protein
MSLTVDEIRKAVTDERDRVRVIDRWKSAYAGAEPEVPLLVKATPPFKDYYIVDFRQAHGTTGLMLASPDTGKIRAMTGVRTPGKSLSRFLRPAEVPAYLDRYRYDLQSHAAGPGAPVTYGDFRDGLVRNFNAANVTVDPVLFWEASDQSLTPYYPFYRVTHKTPDGTDHFLVRVDGQVVEKTTHGGRGM